MNLNSNLPLETNKSSELLCEANKLNSPNEANRENRGKQNIKFTSEMTNYLVKNKKCIICL